MEQQTDPKPVIYKPVIYGPSNSQEGFRDGPGSVSKFRSPNSLCVHQGDVLVADCGNQLVRSIDPQGQVKTFAGTFDSKGWKDSEDQAKGELSFPCALLAVGDVVYVGDKYGIKRVSLGGLYTVAGCLRPISSRDGSLLSSQLDEVSGIALDENGDLLVTERYKNQIRKIHINQNKVTLLKVKEKLNTPSSILFSGGHIIVCDSGNHKIKKIDKEGNVCVLAGSSIGYADGQGTDSKFNNPSQIVEDQEGNILVADTKNNKIRCIDKTGMVTTLFEDFNFKCPRGIAIKEDGSVVVADTSSHRVIEFKKRGPPPPTPFPHHNPTSYTPFPHNSPTSSTTIPNTSPAYPTPVSQHSGNGRPNIPDSIENEPMEAIGLVFGVTTKKKAEKDFQKTFRREQLLQEPTDSDLIDELLGNFPNFTRGMLDMHTGTVLRCYEKAEDPKLKPGCDWVSGPDLPLLAVFLYTLKTPSIFQIVNKILRDRDSLDVEVKDKAKSDIKSWGHYIYNLQCAVINLHGNEEKGTYYRGLSVIPEDFSSWTNPNDIIVWTSFTSCSSIREEAKKFANHKILFEIEVEPNLGAHFKPYSRFPKEDELVFPAFSQFKVLSREQDVDGFSWLIKLTTLPMDISPFTKKTTSQVTVPEITKKDGKILFQRDLSINYEDLKDLKKIGRGGYGAVYSASLGREKVAVKMLSDDALSTGFDQEVSLMAQCSSIYIAQIKGACYSPPSCCIIMELMQQDLKTYLQKWKFQKDGSPIKIRYQIACDIACGIEYLHEKGILHNDVKSPNVLLDGSLRGKVTDFGASRKKVSESVSVGGGGLVGTVCWMAPEVERGGGCGRFSDMFSVGMVLWELVSFETPFVKMTPLEYLNMVNHGEKREHIPVSTPFAPVPPMYFEMINECWRVDPTKRPSATRLVDELLKEFSTL